MEHHEAEMNQLLSYLGLTGTSWGGNKPVLWIFARPGMWHVVGLSVFVIAATATRGVEHGLMPDVGPALSQRLLEYKDDVINLSS